MSIRSGSGSSDADGGAAGNDFDGSESAASEAAEMDAAGVRVSNRSEFGLKGSGVCEVFPDVFPPTPDPSYDKLSQPVRSAP